MRRSSSSKARKIRVSPSATETGTSALVTVQTARDSLDKLTFHEEGVEALAEALADTLAAFDSQPGFGGVAVHHYTTIGGWKVGQIRAEHQKKFGSDRILGPLFRRHIVTFRFLSSSIGRASGC